MQDFITELQASNVPHTFHFLASASQRCKKVDVHNGDSNSRISEHWSESLNTNEGYKTRYTDEAGTKKLANISHRTRICTTYT